jgi:hypothetical protein
VRDRVQQRGFTSMQALFGNCDHGSVITIDSGRDNNEGR